MTSRLPGPVFGAAVAGTVLYVVSALVPGAPLAPDASAATLVERFDAGRGAVLAGAAIAGVAIALLFVFLGGLRTAVAEAGGDGAAAVTVAAWVALVVIVGGGIAPLTAITWRGAAAADPATLQLAFDLSNLSTYSLSAWAAIVSVAAPMWALRRAGRAPVWLLALAGAELVVNVAEIAGTASRTGGNAAGYAFGLGPLLWMAWVLGLAVSLRRAPR